MMVFRFFNSFGLLSGPCGYRDIHIYIYLYMYIHIAIKGTGLGFVSIGEVWSSSLWVWRPKV